jgi:hypothetical protein
MGQQIKSVAQGSVERNLGEHGDRLITLLASRAPRLYCSLKASTALQRAVADTRWDSPGALRNAVACAVAHGAGCRGRCIFAVPACSADAGAVPTSAAFACNTRTASSRRCMAADTRGPWTGKKVVVVDVGVNTVVDESKRMDDVRLAWQIRFWLGAVMVLAHRLFWPTADGRAALQCPQFGHGVLHLGGAGVHRVHGGSTLASTLASHLSWRTSRSCWFRSSSSSLTTSASPHPHFP